MFKHSDIYELPEPSELPDVIIGSRKQKKSSTMYCSKMSFQMDRVELPVMGDAGSGFFLGNRNRIRDANIPAVGITMVWMTPGYIHDIVSKPLQEF